MHACTCTYICVFGLICVFDDAPNNYVRLHTYIHTQYIENVLDACMRRHTLHACKGTRTMRIQIIYARLHTYIHTQYIENVFDACMRRHSQFPNSYAALPTRFAVMRPSPGRYSVVCMYVCVYV
jgi:hypothetical protein